MFRALLLDVAVTARISTGLAGPNARDVLLAGRLVASARRFQTVFMRSPRWLAPTVSLDDRPSGQDRDRVGRFGGPGPA